MISNSTLVGEQDAHSGRQDAVSMTAARPLRVGLIGCGRIADHHFRFISKSKNAQLVAMSDPNLENASRLAKLYGVDKVYASHVEMLDASGLDVVHVLSPPQFHYSQAMDAINHGVHVLLEKPCTFRPEELEDLYRQAESKGVLLCPDFIQLFAPAFLEAASAIDSGELGRVVHVDINLSLDLNASELREAEGLHWSFNLPGGIFHNNSTHSRPNQVQLFFLRLPNS